MGIKPENRYAGCGAGGTLLWVALALILGLVAPHAASGATFRDGSTLSAGPGLPFAFADFNGDQQPDFARVLGGDRLSANRYDYSIWVQLSGSGRTLIRLAAPSGGLSIEARDVNGDHAVDLVLSTAWLKQPVAILLNNGHGVFSRVEPSAFPAAFNTAKAAWQTSADRITEPIALAQESWAGTPIQASGTIAVALHTGFSPISRAQSARTTFVVSHAGRAPPAAVLYL